MNTIQKLLSLLPSKWFSDEAKRAGGILYAVLASLANGLDYVANGIDYVVAQTRISTATADNLINISADFFGSKFPKRSGETDESYRSRIQAALFREKATRAGVISAVEDLGCSVLEVFEPFVDGFFTDFSSTDGCRISDNDRYEAILFIARPINAGSNDMLYTDWNYSDYNYVPGSDPNVFSVSDSDVFDAIESTKAAGTRVWAVFDPIAVGTIDNPNYTSAERYYIPASTGEPGPDTFDLDEDTLDSGSVLL